MVQYHISHHGKAVIVYQDIINTICLFSKSENMKTHCKLFIYTPEIRNPDFMNLSNLNSKTH